jgi:SAM-dependent methyltransferase
MNKRHASLVASQFGPRAAAYVASEVHARGADLDQAAALLGGHSAARVLDLGCGGGHVSFRIAPLVAEVVAYDLASEMLSAVTQVAAERGLANVTTRLGAAEELPFDDASFDFVLSRYSAHHWHGFEPALAEASRVLKPSGTALFMDAVSPGIGLLDTYLQAVELLRDPSHVRDYAIEEWRQALAAAGFVTGGVTMRRVRLEFAAWVERMHTPRMHVDAIRSLQAGMAEDVVTYFDIEPDGSFTIDTAAIEARAGRK